MGAPGPGAVFSARLSAGGARRVGLVRMLKPLALGSQRMQSGSVSEQPGSGPAKLTPPVKAYRNERTGAVVEITALWESTFQRSRLAVGTPLDLLFRRLTWVAGVLTKVEAHLDTAFYRSAFITPQLMKV